MTASAPPTVLFAPRGLGHEDTAVFETFVVPRYLAFFAERLLTVLASGDEPRVGHLQCRTGFPDRELLEKLPTAHVHGCDPSQHAIELARAKASALVEGRAGVAFDYRVVPGLPVPFPDGAFSHAFTLHAPPTADERAGVLAELARVVAPHGQALLAMPLRGSFFELADLLRECALKHELDDLGAAVEAATSRRPSDESLKQELEASGFEFVDVDVRTRTLRFEGGRAFLEDPITRLVLVPELRAELGPAVLSPTETRTGELIDPLTYVREAIDKYWSDATFELTVHVGVVSGRRK